MKKKLLAMLLVICMAMTLLPTVALAVEDGTLTVGTPLEISFTDVNAKSYSFVVAEGKAGLYTFRVTAQTGMAGSLTVTDSNGSGLTEIDGFADDGLTPKGESYSALWLEAGTYTVEVSPRSTSNPTFTLSAEEENCKQLSTLNKSSFSTTAEKDYAYFWFIPENSGWYTFAFSSTGNSSTIANANIFRTVDNEGTKYWDKEFYTNDEVSAYFESPNKYYIKVSELESDGELFRNGGTVSAAAANIGVISDGSGSVSLGYGYSYLQYTPDVTGAYNIKASSTSGDIYDIAVFSATGKWLHSNEDGKDPSTEKLLQYESFQAGTTYYIGVSGGVPDGETVSATVTIEKASPVEKTNLSTATIDAIADQTYTGSAITPALTVKVGDETLTANTDYTVSYTADSNINVGTVNAKIVAAENSDKYTGEKEFSFKIVAKDISGATISSIANQEYTGSAITPAYTVTDDSALVKDKDYTGEFTANVNAGTATLTITGKGNYTGTKTTTFTITPKEIALTAANITEAESPVYDGTNKIPTLNLTDAQKTVLSVESVTKDSEANEVNEAKDVGTYTTTFTVTLTDEGTNRTNYTLKDATNHVLELKKENWEIIAAEISGTVAITYPADTETIGEGTVLTADTTGLTGIVDGDEIEFTYQWKKNGTNVDSATEQAYTIGDTETDAADSVFTVEVGLAAAEEDNANGNYTFTETTSYNSVIVGAKAITGEVSIALTDADTGVLTATLPEGLMNEGKTDVAEGLKLSWKSGAGKATGTATGFTYTLAAADDGKAITAVVEPAETSSYTGSVTSNSLTFSKPSVPQNVTATVGTVDASTGSITLAWEAPATTGGLTVKYTVQKDSDPATEDVEALTNTFSDVNTTTDITFKVKAVNALGESAEATATYTYVDPTTTDASLKSLTISEGTLSPAFAAGTLAYTASVANSVESITVTPAATVDGATVKVNGKDASEAVSLSVGSNTINIVVTATDGETSQTYTITVTRVAAGSPGGGTYVPPTQDKTETTTSPDGTTTTTTTKPDGSKEVAVKAPDGTTADVKVDASGKTQAEVSVSAEAADKGSVTLPIPAVPVASSSAAASTVKVNVPAASQGKAMAVTVPTQTAPTGTVAIIVKADGTEQIVKKSVVTKDGLYVPIDGDAELKIVNNTKSFTDTSGHWASEAISFVSGRELYQGMGDGTFAPGGDMNRAMLVTVLHRLEDMPKGGGVSFDDVASGQYYAEAVAWGAGSGIVQGNGTGFDPNGTVTRQQLATFLYRYAKTVGADTTASGSMSGFNDAGKVQSWASDAMSWAIGAGLINGKGAGVLDPEGNTTRAEVATILMRFCQFMAK